MADISEKLLDLGKQAVKLRDTQELAWHDVAGQMDVSVGKAMLAYNFAKVKPSERVTAKNDAELGKAIVRLRDKELLSWGMISARTGQGEQKCRALYEQTTNTSTKGNRIGKGGRFPGGTSGPKKAVAKKAGGVKKVAKKTTAVKKATGAAKRPAKKASGARKAPAKKAAKAGSGGGSAPSHPLAELDYSELAERLEGRTITVAHESRKDEHLKVKSVKSLEDGVVSFNTVEGQGRNIRVTQISRMSK